jgi:hypothetical protein
MQSQLKTEYADFMPLNFLGYPHFEQNFAVPIRAVPQLEQNIG